METVTMDFAFPVMKELYGRFLVTLYGHCEDVKVVDVRSFYPYEEDMAFVSMEVSHDIAMLLKLQFGNNIRKRPMLKMDPFEESYLNLKILKSRNNEPHYFKMDYEAKLNKIIKFKEYEEFINCVDNHNTL